MNANTTVNPQAGILDGVTGALSSVGDIFAQVYTARAAYESMRNSNRTGAELYDQQSMLANVPRENQVNQLNPQAVQSTPVQLNLNNPWVVGLGLLVLGFIVRKVI